MASIQGLAPLAMNLNPYGVNEEVLAPCIRLQIGKLFTSHSSSRVAIGPIARLHRPLTRRRGIGSPSRLSQLTALSELVQPAQSSRPVPTSGFGVVP
jgi:hypothetical protein